VRLDPELHHGRIGFGQANITQMLAANVVKFCRRFSLHFMLNRTQNQFKIVENIGKNLRRIAHFAAA
jgi:hypothetical protein